MKNAELIWHNGCTFCCDPVGCWSALPSLDTAGLEPRPTAQFGGASQRCRVVAAVVDEAERIAIRHRIRPHQVAPAQFEPVEPMAPARDVDQALEDEHDLRPPGTPIG